MGPSSGAASVADSDDVDGHSRPIRRVNHGNGAGERLPRRTSGVDTLEEPLYNCACASPRDVLHSELLRICASMSLNLPARAAWHLVRRAWGRPPRRIVAATPRAMPAAVRVREPFEWP